MLKKNQKTIRQTDNHKISASFFAINQKKYAFFVNVKDATNNNVNIFIFNSRSKQIVLQKRFTNTYTMGGLLKDNVLNIKLTNKIYNFELH